MPNWSRASRKLRKLSWKRFKSLRNKSMIWAKNSQRCLKSPLRICKRESARPTSNGKKRTMQRCYSTSRKRSSDHSDFMALNRLNASYIRVKSNILVNKFLTFNYSLFLLVTLKIVLFIDCCFFNVIVGLYTMLLRALGRMPKNLKLIKMVYFRFFKGYLLGFAQLKGRELVSQLNECWNIKYLSSHINI